MDWNKWVRQIHRWVSVAFTAAAILNGVTIVRGRYVVWEGLLAVFVLAFLFVTGLYLFVLPYAVKWRSGRRAA